MRTSGELTVAALHVATNSCHVAVDGCAHRPCCLLLTRGARHAWLRILGRLERNAVYNELPPEGVDARDFRCGAAGVAADVAASRWCPGSASRKLVDVRMLRGQYKIIATEVTPPQHAQTLTAVRVQVRQAQKVPYPIVEDANLRGEHHPLAPTARTMTGWLAGGRAFRLAALANPRHSDPG